MSVIVNEIVWIEQVLSAEVQHAYSGGEVKWLGKNGPFVKVDHHMYCLSKLSATSLLVNSKTWVSIQIAL